jgi:thiamine-phosphate pyrophosphorylase
MLLYYITDRSQFPGDETERRRRLLEKIAEAARCGVDYIQLREKDLSARELESLASQAVQVIRENAALRSGERRAAGNRAGASLLINSRSDVALAAGADGVHLRSDDISPSEARKIWRSHYANASSREPRPAPLISVSCHNVGEVATAAAENADLALFAPIFEKRAMPTISPAGLESLRNACGDKIAVVALGGVTLENASSCMRAGAAGIAAIRLFQDHDIADVIDSLGNAKESREA